MALCYAGTYAHLHGYVHLDFMGNVNSRRSTTDYVSTLGSGAVTWVSRLQKIVALSTTEVEYVAATEACKEMIWLKDFMKELGKESVSPPLHNDRQNVIDFSNNPVYHDRTKHIDVRTSSFAYF